MNIPVFSGRPQDDGLSAEEFAKSFRGAMLMLGKTEAEMIPIFGAFMKARSPAERWFDLPTTPKASWNALKDAFLLRFPFKGEPEKSRADWELELLTLTLKPEDLLKKVRYGSASVLSHVAFAYNALELAQNAEMANGSSGIATVRGNLPDTLRHHLEVDYDNWTAFTDAIINIRTTQIRDGIERNAEFNEAFQTLQTLRRQISRAT
ncbi:hypothetical protein BDQ17DRAFT_1370735 [Cyathus striatus]|nr:hypothetical protein BDQ17DRAFT_1370735 [Cyathus striatus]